MPPRIEQPIESRTLAVMVDNEPGVLARIAALNPSLNAFLLVDEEAALGAARASEANWRRHITSSVSDSTRSMPCVQNTPVCRVRLMPSDASRKRYRTSAGKPLLFAAAFACSIASISCISAASDSERGDGSWVMGLTSDL